MKKITFFLFLLLISSLIAACSQGPGKYDTLAQCLTEKGAKMYGAEWCSHCKSQKKAFGSSFGYINYIDCDRNKDKCVAAGVTGYPTWIINGESYPGEQSLQRLASLAGCQLE